MLPEVIDVPEHTAPAGEALSVTSCDDPARWDAYVTSHDRATGYHQWAWRGIFERAFGRRCEYLAADDGDRIVGVLPLVQFDSWIFGKFLVSLPFVNYGGVLADSAAAAQALVDRATVLARDRGLSHVELRHLARRFPSLAAKEHKVTMLLALDRDVQRVWDGLDRKVRNQVRKAEKSGLTTASGGIDFVSEFYPVFAQNMRDLGTPVYSRRFFEEILGTLGDAARVYVVRLGQKPIAAAITLGFRQTLEVPWASSLREHRALNANTLLYWEMIRSAVERGFRTFDFGRSTPNDGPFHFKAQWGAQPHPLAWEYALVNGAAMPDHSPKNPRFSLAIRIWQKLPVSVATAIGPSVVRSIP